MKRIISILLTLALILGMSFSLSEDVAAKELISEEQELDENSIQPRGYYSVTVTDNGNNRYSVYGNTSRAGVNASVSTGFSVTYYYGGTAADQTRVNNYQKSLHASAKVGLAGGGENTLGGTAARAGASNSYSPGQSYLYTVLLVVGSHRFSCNGGSTSFPTSA
jgi:hypothetical protein